jgi:hypothetical protein
MDAKKSSFCRVGFTKARLKDGYGGKGIKMKKKTFLDKAFKEFREKAKIRNGSIIGKIVVR